ncbi:MAG TPA: cob(I)yrinic acid a,c-diamide adenosyltransferase [Thermoanaerobaculia bacterium]|nr:cob(I)yrinic acid a,c-diamide adenosyltransferase [Thermoanaerobaculia bacterium]HUM30378.1 cob(I)yrinic acid a,c-diamide adenosyltransferase [Thermoanaerobaculia bacterium]HXK68611.1 cob(I)yrinic acid a,c-diamide adenosyltransferase [Thermoanaerobaculia bacterium]
MSGKFQVYTGDGKGKTTAAIGLAIRAAGAGFRVAFLQFDKGHDPSREEHYAERRILRITPGIDLFPTGKERINPDGTFRFGVTGEDRDEALRGLHAARTIMESGQYKVVILDDVIGGISYGLVMLDEILELVHIHAANPAFELVMTGRNVPKELADRAHLVSEMRKVKHYFDEGLPARRGIEF